MHAFKPLTFLLLIGFNIQVLALEQTLYASNNSHILSVNEAYQRLQGEPERQLQGDLIRILQQAHIQQGQFQDILGTYLMSTTGEVTGDNTESFTFSPYQKLSNKKLFHLSSTIAHQLNQDSIALVAIEDKSSDLGVSANASQDTIRYQVLFCKSPLLTDVLAKIKSLPAIYQNAYSIHIQDLKQSFSEAKVSRIEWLGHGLDALVLEQTFPEAKVNAQSGLAWLVFKDGHVSSL